MTAPAPVYLLSGVIPDGSSAGFINSSKQLRIPRQSTAVIRVAFQEQFGTPPVDLAGAVGVLCLRARLTDASPRVMRSAVGVSGSNLLDFPFTESETDQPEYALYYDMVLIWPTGDRVQAIWFSEWLPQPNVTRIGDVPTVVPPAVPSLVNLPPTAGHNPGDAMILDLNLVPKWAPDAGGSGGLPLEKSYILGFTIGVSAIPIDLTADFDPIEGIRGAKYVIAFGSGTDAQGLPASQLGWTAKLATNVLIVTDGQFEGPITVTIRQTGDGFSGTAILLPTDTLADGRQGKRVLFVDEQGNPLTLTPPYPVLLSSSVDLDDLVTVPTLGNDLQLTDGYSLVGPGTAHVLFDWSVPLPAIAPPSGGTPDPTALHKAGAEDISGVKTFLVGADPLLAAGDHLLTVKKQTVAGTPPGAITWQTADGVDADATHAGQPGGGQFFQGGKGGNASAARPAGLSGFVFSEGGRGGDGSATQPPGGGDSSGFVGGLPGDLGGWAGATDTIPGGDFQINGGNRGDYVHARGAVRIGSDGLSPVIICEGGSQPVVVGNNATEVTIDGKLNAKFQSVNLPANLPTAGSVGEGAFRRIRSNNKVAFSDGGAWWYADGSPVV